MADILIAVDNSKNSMRAVKYVAKTFKPTGTVTILTVLPDIAGACELNGPSLVPTFKKAQEAFCDLEVVKRIDMKDFMDKAKAVLVENGFASKDVSIRIRKKRFGIARDILREAKKHHFDTIVVGRRGLSAVKEYMFGSISHKVVQSATNTPVIVVD